MTDRDPAMPTHSDWLVRWFHRYCRRYAAKHFHAVRLAKSGAAFPPATGEPLIFVMNHPAWWDVITAFLLSSLMPDYRHYAPIDAGMLKKYGLFRRLGLFGVDQTPRGGAVFLRTANAIFSRPHRALWVTAQGRFADPRDRPLNLRPGAGAVASRLTTGWVIPVAVEYPFWDERTPELLIRVGESIPINDHTGDSRVWTTLIEDRLTETMDALAKDAIGRDAGRFETMIQGRAGVGGVYDWWRSLRGRKGHAP